MSIAKLSKQKLKGEILKEAKVLGMHPGSAEIIADKVTEKVMKWSRGRSMITKEDLNERLAKEIKVYDRDLAYLFESKDKII